MIRIANAQGFWGDSLEAPLEQLRGGPIDYLTLDYLAEVTMSILEKQRARDPKAGYARDFPQMIGRGAKDIIARNVKVVANAGGVNPEACADAVAADAVPHFMRFKPIAIASQASSGERVTARRAPSESATMTVR